MSVICCTCCVLCCFLWDFQYLWKHRRFRSTFNCVSRKPPVESEKPFFSIVQKHTWSIINSLRGVQESCWMLAYSVELFWKTLENESQVLVGFNAGEQLSEIRNTFWRWIETLCVFHNNVWVLKNTCFGLKESSWRLEKMRLVLASKTCHVSKYLYVFRKAFEFEWNTICMLRGSVKC